MQVASTLCLAIASRALQPMLAGIEMLQSYIEWTIATASTAVLVSSTRINKFQLVISTGTIFGIFDALKEAAQREEEEDCFYLLSATTMQGISLIMFTNSFVSWVVDSISSSSSIGLAIVSIFSGIVASKVIVSLLHARKA